MATINSWNNTVSAADVTLNGGAVNIGSDATSGAINIGTGGAARVITMGNTTGASQLSFSIGTGDYTLSSATGTLVTTLDTGETREPFQPAFLAYNANNQNDVTGDGTAYTVVFDTEVFDQGSNFDGTSTFTAPITARYDISTIIYFVGVGAGHTSGNITVVTSNRSITFNELSPGSIRDNAGQVTEGNNILFDMDSADTAYVEFTVDNLTKTIDLLSGRCYFSVNLAC